MKTNLTTLLFYYHKILYGLIYLSMKAQALLRVDNMFKGIFLISCLLCSTLWIFSIFNSLNIMDTSAETLKYLEGLDCPMELIDSRSDSKEFKLPVACADKVYSKFLKLFINDHINLHKLPKELQNSYYYTDASHAQATQSNFSGCDTQVSLQAASQHRDKNLHETPTLYLDCQYLYKSAYFQEISYEIDKLSSLLKDMQTYRADILTTINSVHINILGDIKRI